MSELIIIPILAVLYKLTIYWVSQEFNDYKKLEAEYDRQERAA